MTRGGDKGLHNKFCCPWFLSLYLFSLGSWLVIPFVLHSPLASQTGGRSPLHDPLRSLPSLRRSDRVAPGGLPPAAPTERVKG